MTHEVRGIHDHDDPHGGEPRPGADPFAHEEVESPKSQFSPISLHETLPRELWTYTSDRSFASVDPQGPQTTPSPARTSFISSATKLRDPLAKELAELRASGSNLPQEAEWLRREARAYIFRGALRDFWHQAERVVRGLQFSGSDEALAEKTRDALADKAFTDALPKLFLKWDRERRNFPPDWAELERIQKDIADQLDWSLAIGSHTVFEHTSAFDGVKALFEQYVTTIKAELARQGLELTGATRFSYGSASQAAAAVSRSATDHFTKRSELSTATALQIGDRWLKQGDGVRPRPSRSTALRSPVEDVISALFKAAEAAVVNKNSSTDAEATAYRKAVDELFKGLKDFAQTSADLRSALESDRVLKEDEKWAIHDATSILYDILPEKLAGVADTLDLEERDYLVDAVEKVRKLRTPTLQELAIEKAEALGLDKYWSDSKEGSLVVLPNEKRKAVEDIFSEGLAAKLKKWVELFSKIDQGGSANNEDLHDVTYAAFDTLTRYRSKLRAELSPQQLVDTGFIRGIDAMLTSMSNKLGSLYQRDIELF